MKFSPLKALHDAFTTSLHNHTYLNFSKGSLKKPQQTTTKQMRLYQVFACALQQIREILHNLPPASIELSQLQALKQDGKLQYKRYSQATTSWPHMLLKGLVRCTPAFLKRFLPACCRDREQAEIQTRRAYKEYQSFLKETIQGLIEQKSQAEKSLQPADPIQKFHSFSGAPPCAKRDDPLQRENPSRVHTLNEAKERENLAPPKLLTSSSLQQEAPTPLNTSEIERQQAIDAAIHALQRTVALIEQFALYPFSLIKYKQLISGIATIVQHLKSLDAEHLHRWLNQAGLNRLTLEALTHPGLTSALATNNDQKILEILASTEWGESFAEACNQKGYVKFGLRRLPGTTELVLEAKNDQGDLVREKDLHCYRGKIILIVPIPRQAQNELKQLIQFLIQYDTFRPYQIEIRLVQGCTLTSSVAELLIELSKYVAEVKIKGLKTLNFKEIGLSSEKEDEWIQRLDHFTWWDLEEIVLSPYVKEKWMPSDFSRLLSLSPNIKLLQQCFQYCPTPQEIILPPLLTQLDCLDLTTFSPNHISHLLACFHHVRSLNLSGVPLTDRDLKAWIEKGYLVHVQKLELEHCKAITTDTLFSLAKLSQLTQLSLPDLPQGHLALDQLPTFDDPFKIKLFYTASQVTQQRAPNLYTGPSCWAAVFQIPLARLGVKPLFSPGREILDPKSVAYWLYQKDYEHLEAETSITTIFADSNALLDDDQLVQFVKKFPNTERLSLYECPHVTTAGVIALLKECPNLKKLDLTGCAQIKEDLLLGEGHEVFLKRLEKLIITQTGISQATAELFKEMLGKLTVVYENTTLKITDDQLTDEASFATFLKAHPLNKLKRIDLSDCTMLTNAMLSQLIHHLNAPMWLDDKSMQENPERLNLAVLNLTNCSQITDAAFQIREEGNQRLSFQPLENLDRIVSSGTQISSALASIYPQVTFQKEEMPVTIELDPTAQIQACNAYYKAKEQSKKEKKALQRLAHSFIHNRIVAELFSFACSDQDLVALTLSRPFNLYAAEYCNFTLSFNPLHPRAETATFPVHRDVLYGQSLRYFVEGFRAGGMYSKISALYLENQHATTQAGQAIIGLLYEKISIEDLDWKTAADVAELVGPHNLKFLKKHYIDLLKRMRSQFDLSRAGEMIETAIALEDLEGKAEYEQVLLAYLENYAFNLETHQHAFQDIANLAASHYGMERLKNRVLQIQTAQTQALIIEQQLVNAGWLRGGTSFYPM